VLDRGRNDMEGGYTGQKGTRVKNQELEMPKLDQLNRPLAPVSKDKNQAILSQYESYQNTKRMGQKFYKMYIEKPAIPDNANAPSQMGDQNYATMYKVTERSS